MAKTVLKRIFEANNLEFPDLDPFIDTTSQIEIGDAIETCFGEVGIVHKILEHSYVYIRISPGKIPINSSCSKEYCDVKKIKPEKLFDYIKDMPWHRAVMKHEELLAKHFETETNSSFSWLADSKNIVEHANDLDDILDDLNVDDILDTKK